MNEFKVMLRVDNAEEGNERSIIVCLPVNETVIQSCCRAAQMASELRGEPYNSPHSEVVISVPAILYEGHEMDENLRDLLWDEYGGRVVDTFPEMNEEPFAHSVELVVTAPDPTVETILSYDWVWVRHNDFDSAESFTQPVNGISSAMDALVGEFWKNKKPLEGPKSTDTKEETK